MLVESRKLPRAESNTKKPKPTVIPWNNTKLLRSQSINNCVRDIFETSKSMGFVKINLIGASSSGKTVLGDVLAHQLHVLDPTFEVHKLKDSDLIDFKKTIQNLSTNNQILIFDDLSGLVATYGKAALDTLRSEITTVRHIGESDGDGSFKQDRRIIMILNFHAQKMLDKFLRISNFTFYTDCQLEEIGYLEELLGKHQKYKIAHFAKLRSQSRMQHRFTFVLGTKDSFTYKDGDPFRVLLYNNGLSTRFVVSPQLKWILNEGDMEGTKSCEICFPAEKSDETMKNLDEFVEDFSRKFSNGTAKKAVELKLRQRGYYTQTKRVMQAEKYIEQFFDEKKINLEELAKVFKLEERTTKLFPDKAYKPRKKYDLKKKEVKE
jgi:hypothetical protein